VITDHNQAPKYQKFMNQVEISLAEYDSCQENRVEDRKKLIDFTRKLSHSECYQSWKQKFLPEFAKLSIADQLHLNQVLTTQYSFTKENQNMSKVYKLLLHHQEFPLSHVDVSICHFVMSKIVTRLLDFFLEFDIIEEVRKLEK
jgi:hypothetical protein